MRPDTLGAQPAPDRVTTLASGPAWSRIALLGSVLVILLATLSPGQWSQTEGRPPGFDARLADVLLNLALFAPLGAALGHRGRSVAQALFLGTLLSGALELAQLWVPGRTAGLSDVLVNAIGTSVGWAAWRTSAVWARPDPRVAGRLAIGAALIATTVVGLTGVLLKPTFPSTPYFGHWTPEFGRLRVYHGRVLEASVGGTTISPGLIHHFVELRSRLVAGEPLRVRAVAGAPVVGLAPVLSVNDWWHEVFMVGQDGEDLVYRYMTRGASLGLDSPELRLPGALHGVGPGDRLAVTVRPEHSGYCIDVNGTSTCGIGFTAGMGWALLAYGQGVPPTLYRFLSVLWLAALAMPVGYWSHARWQSGLALVLLAAGLFLVPAVAGLVPTTTSELAGALAGVLGGGLLQRALRARDDSRSGRGRER